MTLAGRSFGMSAVLRPCHEANGERPRSQLIGSSLPGRIPKQSDHPRIIILEGHEMEDYCTSCGKWRWLAAFWRCRDCLDQFYDGKRRGGNRAALVDRNDSVH